MKKLKYFLLSIIFVFALTTLAGCFEKTRFTISIKPAEHGIVTTNKTRARYDEEITITVTPEEGYLLKEVRLNTEVLEDLTFIMPQKDVEISATFALGYNVNVDLESSTMINLSTDFTYAGVCN